MMFVLASCRKLINDLFAITLTPWNTITCIHKLNVVQCNIIFKPTLSFINCWYHHHLKWIFSEEEMMFIMGVNGIGQGRRLTFARDASGLRAFVLCWFWTVSTICPKQFIVYDTWKGCIWSDLNGLWDHEVTQNHSLICKDSFWRNSPEVCTLVQTLWSGKCWWWGEMMNVGLGPAPPGVTLPVCHWYLVPTTTACHGHDPFLNTIITFITFNTFVWH